MKQTLFGGVLFLTCLLHAQSTVILHGTVTDAATNTVVANTPVSIQADSSFSSYINTVYTDANGQYADTLLNFMPSLCTFYLQTPSCNGTYQYGLVNYVQGNPASTLMDFLICQGGSAGSCSAGFSAQVVGNNQVQFNNFSVGSNPNATLTYSWTFGGNTGTSTLQNPIITFPSTGIYMNCLTITDNTGCSSTYCDSVWVGSCQANFSYQLASGTAYLQNLSQSANGSYTTNWLIGGQVFTNHDIVWQAPAGTYNVCLAITDSIAQCTDTICQMITISTSSSAGYDLIGSVLADSTNTGGGDTIIIYLIQHDTIAGTLTAIDSTYSMLNSQGVGTFLFSGKPAGTYLVKAAILSPNSSLYADFIPSYYSYFNGGVLFWSAATSIDLPSLNPAFPPTYNYGIHLQQGINPGGPGFIGGLISQGANKTVGDPIANQEVILLNQNDLPIAYTHSDANGEYSFSNLAYGTYKIYAEVLGLPTIPSIVSISANNPSATNVSISMNSTGVTSLFSTEIIGYIHELSPNPIVDEANISIELKEKVKLQIEVINLLGQVMYQQTEDYTTGKQNINLQLNGLESGIYFMRILANGKTQKISKFIKE